MKKYYRKRPMVVQAIEVDINVCQAPELKGFVSVVAEGEGGRKNFVYIVETATGKATAREGDYIIIGTNDEKYPCRREIFHKIYDEVEVEAQVDDDCDCGSECVKCSARCQ